MKKIEGSTEGATEIAVAFYEGDFVVAVASLIFSVKHPTGTEEGKVFEYLVRSGRDGHWRRLCVQAKPFSCLAPRSVSSDAEALAWLRKSIDDGLARNDPRVTTCVTIREVHSADWDIISRVVESLGHATADARVNQATGELEILP